MTKKIFDRGGVFVGNRQRQRDKPTLKGEQHQQILEQLEKHRPTKSVSQEQPAAERTNVLYDFVSATELTAAHKKMASAYCDLYFFFSRKYLIYSQSAIYKPILKVRSVCYWSLTSPVLVWSSPGLMAGGGNICIQLLLNHTSTTLSWLGFCLWLVRSGFFSPFFSNEKQSLLFCKAEFMLYVFMCIRLVQTHVTMKMRLVQRSHSGLQDFSSCGQRRD